jgi:hypothetical protein
MRYSYKILVLKAEGAGEHFEHLCIGNIKIVLREIDYGLPQKYGKTL